MAVAGLAGPAVAALWVGLTVQTGTTFHLFPLIIVMAPAFVATRLAEVRTGPRASAALLALGPGAVATAWLALGALDARPVATFFEGQRGGVGLEVLVFSLLGMLLAARMLKR